MTTTPPTMDRALSSEDGQTWQQSGPVRESDWPASPDPNVVKLVLGQLDKQSESKPWQDVLDILTSADGLKKHFPNLTHLHLWGLPMEKLGPLPEGLKVLDVRKSPNLEALRRLPEGLKLLDAADCQKLRELPPTLPQGLEELYLHGCASLQSARVVKPILSHLKNLQLYGCRFKDLDASLCGEEKENVAGKVRAHFQKITEQGEAFLSECKLVILGNGGVGKTSLVRSIKGLPFDENEASTEGIRLWTWDGGDRLPFPEHPGIPLQLNIWDFGGQDLYHNTHRLFLESRAVFIIAWRQPRKDGKPFRKNHPDDPIRPLSYWFDQVQASNPDATILLVRTWCDDVENPPGDWRDQVAPEYHHLHCHEISSKTGSGEWEKLLESLLDAVRVELRSVEAITLGSGRKAVRDEIRQWQPVCEDDQKPLSVSERPVMEFREYLTLVEETYRKLGLDESTVEESHLLLDYLHQIGAVYSPRKWREGKFGAHPIIIDQRWAIDAIYQPFIPGSDANLAILSNGGEADADLLDELAWEDEDDKGERRFKREHQWVFREFMLSCGVMVPLQEPGRYVLPELLPAWRTVQRNQYDPMIIAVTSNDSPGRSYHLRHRSLGTGFGCLLVGRLLAMFAKSPVFRYGGIGRVELGIVRDSLGYFHEEGEEAKPRMQATVLIQWQRENDDAYYGDLIITCHSDEESRDPEILQHLWEELSSIPGFPKEAGFELKSGRPIAVLAPLRVARMPKADRKFAQANQAFPGIRNKPRLFTVGLSVAGEDEGENRNIEFWPRVLRASIDNLPDAEFSVLYYKSDMERKSVSELVGDLVKADLMIAFIGKKYLHSEYCMIEFLMAAQYWQHDDTFGGSNDWQHRLWVLPLKDSSYLLARTDKIVDEQQQVAAREWASKWMDRGIEHEACVKREFRGQEKASQEAVKKYPYHEWMILAQESEEKIAPILAALKQARHGWIDKPLPPELEKDDLEKWGSVEIQPLAQRVREAMTQIALGHSSADRSEKLRLNAIKFWRRHDIKDAVDAFEWWVNSHPDASAKRSEYLADKPMEDTDLNPVRERWRVLLLDNQKKIS